MLPNLSGTRAGNEKGATSANDIICAGLKKVKVCAELHIVFGREQTGYKHYILWLTAVKGAPLREYGGLTPSS